MMKINEFIPNSRLINLTDSSNVQDSQNKSSGDFSDILMEKLDEVNNDQLKAENATESFIKGEDTDIHNVMLSTEEAKMSLQMAVQVRNKLVEAYQEINRMQF